MATRASEARDFFKRIQENKNNEKYENSYHKNGIEKIFINKEKAGFEQNDYNKLF